MPLRCEFSVILTHQNTRKQQQFTIVSFEDREKPVNKSSANGGSEAYPKTFQTNRMWRVCIDVLKQYRIEVEHRVEIHPRDECNKECNTDYSLASKYLMRY